MSRKCKHCRTPLTPRAGETVTAFQQRAYCDVTCIIREARACQPLPVVVPPPAPKLTAPKLTAHERKLVNDLVTVHKVRSSDAIYVSDSMSGNSWTCRVEFRNRASGHLFSVTIPIDENKYDAAHDKFYAKVKAFKAALDATLAGAK